MSLSFQRRGAGEPLLLVHGLGSQGRIWAPVLDALATDFDVIAVDLPGFGSSPPMSTAPSPVALAEVLAEFATGLGVGTPHVAGNSLGGWVALELAKAGQARSVTALSPAGVWPRRTPLPAQASLVVTRGLARGLRFAIPVLRSPVARRVFLAGQFARPTGVPGADAIAEALAFGSCPGFWPAFRASRLGRFIGGETIAVPVTIAFGEHDRLLVPRRNAARDQVPPQTRDVVLPGCGHVPMWDDPTAVVALIKETAAAARR